MQQPESCVSDSPTQQRSAVGCKLIAEIARSYGEVRLKVRGSSMIPAIWPGDVITVRRCDIAELQAGQIVLYRREGNLVAHRIIRSRGDLLITKGDSLQNVDPQISRSDLVGEVISVVRNSRNVKLKQSSWRRACSFILRRSDFCMRMTLRLGLLLRRRPGREISWVS